MKKFNFLICYDISNPSRLRKIAKYLESISIRIQKSIFFYPNVNKQSIKDTSKTLSELINEEQDDIRIYQIDINNSININNAINLKQAIIIKD